MIARSILKKAKTSPTFDHDLTFPPEVVKDRLVRLISRVQQHPPRLPFMRATNISMRARISINRGYIEIRIYEAVSVDVKVIIDSLPLRKAIFARYTAHETPIQSWLDVPWVITEILRGNFKQNRI